MKLKYIFNGLQLHLVGILIVVFILSFCTMACNHENPVTTYESMPTPKDLLTMLEDAGVKYSSAPKLLYIYHGKERSDGSDEWGFISSGKFELQPRDGMGGVTSVTDSVAVFVEPFEHRSKIKIPNVTAVYLSTWTKSGYEYQGMVMQTQNGDYLKLHRYDNNMKGSVK